MESDTWNVGEWLAAAEAQDPPSREDRQCVRELLGSASFQRVVGEMLRRQRERAVGMLQGLSPMDALAVQEAKTHLRLVQLAFEVLEEVIHNG